MERPKEAHAVVKLAVDLVILTVLDGRLQILVVERGNEPYRGRLALPGGFMRPGEDLPTTAWRELQEETGVGPAHIPHLEQVGAYSEPDRDPRGRVVTIAYLALAPDLPAPTPGSDALNAAWVPAHDILAAPTQLAFDHDTIVADAVEHACAMLEHTTLATAFCTTPFTIGDLKSVYEAVWGVPLDIRNFYRKVRRADGFIEATGEKRASDVGRPAELFRRGLATVINPPMLRTPADSVRPAV
ncbi:NUDIX domain-containing protein [Catenulispora pinisilvae]|uniref:NUDIX domain-containing protein n=1 Tax=Catenulispora pinisilvae TaxID=2705253 RepID=UPI001890DA85|nr:NUDIX domain-containing protein [Catenulispora pinisilvae]